MATEKRRLTTCFVVAIGCLVIMVAGLAVKDKAAEQWYLWKLESGEESERISAAERLAEMRSSRAIPRLVELLCEYALRQPDRSPRYGAAAYFPARRELPAHYSAEALLKIGPPALPSLAEALANEDVRVRAFVYSTLLSIGPATPRELPSLIELLAHESAEVRTKAIN